MRGTQILMHKGNKVATCSFDSIGYLKSISKIHDKKLLPLSVGEENPVLDLQRWILARSIAPNRRDLASRREFYGSSSFLSETGISLFDHYWFANDTHNDWEKENPFDNWDCKKDSLYLMYSKPEELKNINTNSPNFTIPGKKPRMWYRSGNDICLLHGDAQKEMHEYKLAKENPVVNKREYAILSGIIYAVTIGETNKNIEQISFEDLYNSCAREDRSKMENLQYCCEKYGLNNWKQYFSHVCAFDEATGNENRELCDIHVLRNSDTLEIIDFAKL